MKDPNEDFFAKFTSDVDQLSAGLGDLGKAFSSFYEGLIRGGVPKAAAAQMTCSAINGMFLGMNSRPRQNPDNTENF